MNKCVVVGGGICGLLAAYLLKKHGQDVVLIEQAEECGGLLRSVTDTSGHYYDQGSHIPNLSGVSELDDFLFGPEQARQHNWVSIPELMTGNYFQSTWDLQTQTIDARKLNKDDYLAGIAQLLANEDISQADNIEAYCKETLGPLFFEKLVKPVIVKLYGEQSDYTQLSARNSINYFGASRILAFNPDITGKLKELPAFDAKLGYHTRLDYAKRLQLDGSKDYAYLYPKSPKGSQYWVDYLVDKVTSAGVKIENSLSVSELKCENKHVTSLTLSDGRELTCDWVYWSAPPIFALRLLEDYKSRCRPNFRTANIFHFTFDAPLKNTQSHLLWNWDSCSSIFRITMYPNLNDSRAYSISAEVLSSADEAKEIKQQDILQALIEMDLVPKDANLLDSTTQVIHNTFPVPTKEFNHEVSAQFERLESLVDNLCVSGRFSGKLWLLNDILHDTYTKINKTFGEVSA
ncbi:FAD-dependent oxidoreductase [Pseudoalteromonas sp. SMS1]|uniref:FAD-dependent oxidoreductase n=1 Tax=Pseudoalteromonas sp. SMS1 TaxID=2908894 RepID=UPI001F39B836|nr:FAD-dependent oxidoreductase [Pseudoalteromonas sp. SMS1]MCF2859368.1 FAD-dependent oxidoreductase [Pseudoalteromonas sp. SMS1]